jgi:hypothetical protein
VLACLAAGQANGSGYKGYAHASYVCVNGKDTSKKRACKYISRIVPKGEAALRRYINDDCLEEIIDRETADTWNHRVYNYQGSGAYGLAQALPGHKMASAGRDWATNPITQIRWMRDYVNSRYGGSCGALAHHNAYGWY